MNLTRFQRDVLLEHIDRPNGIPFHAAGARAVTVHLLIDKGLLRGDRLVRPRCTFATDRGRHTIARLLGEVADTIIRNRGRLVFGIRKTRVGRPPINRVLTVIEEAWTAITRTEPATAYYKPTTKPLRDRDRTAYMRDYKRRRREKEKLVDG
jgi:hypothetical protein